MTDDMTEDVVVSRVVITDNGYEISGYGRDTLEVATEFCRRPRWPAKQTDSFIAVDDWGHGDIVAASPTFSNWIGHTLREFKSATRA